MVCQVHRGMAVPIQMAVKTGRILLYEQRPPEMTRSLLLLRGGGPHYVMATGPCRFLRGRAHHARREISAVASDGRNSWRGSVPHRFAIPFSSRFAGPPGFAGAGSGKPGHRGEIRLTGRRRTFTIYREN